MTREFIEGYIYKLGGLPYETDGNHVCNVHTEHHFLTFGHENTYDCFVISEADELDVSEGMRVERLDNIEIGFNENDGVTKFIVVDRSTLGEGAYLVASIC